MSNTTQSQNNRINLFSNPSNTTQNKQQGFNFLSSFQGFLSLRFQTIDKEINDLRNKHISLEKRQDDRYSAQFDRYKQIQDRLAEYDRILSRSSQIRQVIKSDTIKQNNSGNSLTLSITPDFSNTSQVTSTQKQGLPKRSQQILEVSSFSIPKQSTTYSRQQINKPQIYAKISHQLGQQTKILNPQQIKQLIITDKQLLDKLISQVIEKISQKNKKSITQKVGQNIKHHKFQNATNNNQQRKNSNLNKYIQSQSVNETNRIQTQKNNITIIHQTDSSSSDKFNKQQQSNEDVIINTTNNNTQNLTNIIPRNAEITSFKPIQNISILTQHLKSLTSKVSQIQTQQFYLKKSLHQKINLLQNSFTELQIKCSKMLNQHELPMQNYNKEIQKLRNQLQQYKLKKQAKYMKLLMNNQSTDKNNKLDKNQTQNQYLEYLAQKVHYLMQSNKQFLPKDVYNKEIQHVHQIFMSIRKRLAEKISVEDAQKFIKLSINNGPNIKFNQENTNSQKQQQQNSKQSQLAKEQFNPLGTSLSSISPHQINQLLSPFTQLLSTLQSDILSIKNATIPKLSTQILSIMNQSLPQINQNIKTHDKFMKEMNLFYNQKFKDIQQLNYQYKRQGNRNQYTNQNHPNQSNKRQSIDDQLNQQEKQRIIKRYNSNSIVGSQSHIKQNIRQHDLRQNDLRQQPSIELQHQYLIKNSLNIKSPQQALKRASPHHSQGTLPTQHNFQVNSLKKRLNKLSIKYDQLKSDMKNLKQQLSTNYQILKNNQGSKTDWESFKKGMAYFDQRVREISKVLAEVLDHIQREEQQESGNSSGIAAKKKWTCLFCDKDLKHYQTKLGTDLKLAPSFQSPRIGGYYKQSSKQKQYQKLYLNPSNRPRKGSIHLSKHHSQQRQQPQNLSPFQN